MNRYFPPWIALGVGLVLTIVVSLEVKEAIEHDAANEFAFTSDQVVLKIQERLNAYALTLKGGAGLFAASNAVDRRVWQTYVEKLRAQDNVPGVQGIGFSKVIPPRQLAAHIASVRAEGFPDYTVRPAGERALYTSIIYLEPFRDLNLRAFGFDMFSEPVRRAAMEQARDTGTPALSGKVELVQETGTEVQAGTLMYVPVYRNGAPADTVEQRRAALIGWSYSPYRMKDLLEGILTNWDNHKTKQVDLHIYAGLEVKAESLLYDSHPAGTQKVDPLFYQQRTIDFNGQHWLLVFRAGKDVLSISYASAWAALAGGILLSSLLCGLMLALARTQARAREIADTLTEELSKSERFLISTIDGLSAHIAVLDAQGAIILTNKAYRDFGADNGIEPRTVSEGANYLAVCDMASGEHSTEAIPFAKGVREVLAGKRQSLRLEYPCHSPDEERWFIARVTPFNDVALRRVVVAHENITEQKRIENARMASERELRLLAESMPQIVWVCDTEGKNIYFNQQWVSYTGLSLEESSGHGWHKPFHPDDQQRGWDAWQNAVTTQGLYSLECRLRRADGVYLWWLIRGVPAFGNNGEVYKWFGTCTNIDDIKRTETELVQHRGYLEQREAELSAAYHQLQENQSKMLQIEKLSALGTLVGGVAHEINNPLMGAMNCISAVSRRSSDAKILEILDEATVAMQRIAAIVRNMLVFVRTDSHASGSCKLPIVLEQAWDTLRPRLLHSGVEKMVHLPDELPPLACSEDSLRQILINLLSNSCDAVQDCPRRLVEISAHRHGDTIEITVADTGSGIPGQLMDKIFDPFLTTKPPGKGTGLGLYVSRQLVEAAGGTINAANRPIGGACFTVRFSVGK